MTGMQRSIMSFREHPTRHTFKVIRTGHLIAVKYCLPGLFDTDPQKLKIQKVCCLLWPMWKNSLRGNRILNLTCTVSRLMMAEEDRPCLFPALPIIITVTSLPGIHLMVSGWYFARLKISCYCSATATCISCRPLEAK